MVLTLLKQAIQKNSATSKGFLIDGYPRELDQGKRFEPEVASVERVIYFQVLNIAIRIVFTQSPRSGSGILRWACLSVCVCLFVYLRNHRSKFRRNLCALPRQWLDRHGGVAMRYVLPALWMTSTS